MGLAQTYELWRELMLQGDASWWQEFYVRFYQAFLENEYFVTPERAALAVETGTVAAQAAADLGRRDMAVYVGIM